MSKRLLQWPEMALKMGVVKSYFVSMYSFVDTNKVFNAAYASDVYIWRSIGKMKNV